VTLASGQASRVSHPRGVLPLFKQRRKLVPCEHCGAPDKTDLSAESQGLISKSEAARRSGRSTTWISDRIQQRQIEMADFAGRKYIVLESLARFLTRVGKPTPAQAQLDHLIESNQLADAQLLHRQLHPEAYGFSQSTQSAATPAELPDPWQDFLVRNLNREGSK
jgi:hypothetical protein